MKYTCKQRILMHLMMRGELYLYDLMQPAIGGTSAGRRIRELREMGVDIKWKYKGNSRTTIYYLGNEPSKELKEKVMQRGVK